MTRILLLFFCAMPFIMGAQEEKPTANTPPKTIAELTKDTEEAKGFFTFYWKPATGQVLLLVDRWNQEFLYINGLTGGLGSNDIGLDRNQLGEDRIVSFIRSGNKVLLRQHNYRYRALSVNAAERQAVSDAFAESVLWGFTALAVEGDKVLLDLTPFLLRDAHGVAQRLQQRGQGSYKPDNSRSIINRERCKSFPKNTEFDALVTLMGEPKGDLVRSVTPNAEYVSLDQHHSFVELPDNNYKPRLFDPRCGFIPLRFYDYATPIDQALEKRYILRHRLEKKTPGADISDPVEPIVYYLDPGTPEPIRSALLEGASWWNQAFEAAGYRNAFQVKMLPPDADPMDVRFNVINWTHRSTRGWSYGSSVVDPRTGEIIKGHVLLGSLRVRQDFLIAQGLVDAFKSDTAADPRMLELALARLRQLSAHEVGHTIGLTHNFAASIDNRASVMDYPHPLVNAVNGTLDFSSTYATGIGDWDKRAILYGYEDFSDDITDETIVLGNILAKTESEFRFITDEDARPQGGLHPFAHLWDNGEPVGELERITELRAGTLKRFNIDNIPVGAPLSTLEDVLVPVYYMHRYQVEAVAKYIGGIDYNYAVRQPGNEQPKQTQVSAGTQKMAFDALAATLNPTFLALPEHILQLIPPPAYGYERGRESFKVYTGFTLDPLAAAEASADHTLTLLLHPERLARMLEYWSRDNTAFSPYTMLRDLQRQLSNASNTKEENLQTAIARVVEQRFLYHLLALSANRTIQPQVSAMALQMLRFLESDLQLRMPAIGWHSPNKAHILYLQQQIRLFFEEPSTFSVPKAPPMPDGAPIGCGE